MRNATKARKRKALEIFGNDEIGVAFNWRPGNKFPNMGTWESFNSEAVTVTVDKSLFADDTTPAGKKKEMRYGLEIMKEEMGEYEERNNDDKEEYLEFGTIESEEIRMLGCYMGAKKDVDMRIKRAGAAWFKIRKRLKKARITKRMQARVIEACIESTLLFDCQTRTWQVGEVKRLQSTVDRFYRYAWSRRNMQPLRQMQAESKNMQDIRNELGIKSVRYKIEKRVLERIGHVCRMKDERLVKAVTLGWMRELEGLDKVPGKKRKTLLYWMKLLREAGIDHTRIDELTADRKAWKATVMTRMKHLEDWERKGAKSWQGERGERNKVRERETGAMFRCEICNQLCKSKGGLGAHKFRKHNISSLKKVFKCDECAEEFTQEANLKNHLKVCTGLRAEDRTKRKCELCNGEYSKSNSQDTGGPAQGRGGGG